MAIEIEASTLLLSRVDMYPGVQVQGGQFARWVSVSQSPRLGDTRQGAAEVFTETLQTREFVTDLKYVMGTDISSSSSSSVSSLWSALVLTLDRGGLQICFVCFWLRNPKLIVVPRCSSPNFRDQQTLTGCCYCWMDQNKQINSWINQTQMII